MDIKLEAFEGPFDLLFHLIEKNEVDIYDIPIAKITEQYMEYIEDMDMENISEFLVMAATLLKIKAKMLIPNEVVEEAEDPREEVVEKLLEDKKIKDTVDFLKEKEEEENKRFYRDPFMFEETERELETIDEYLEGVNLDALYNAFKDILKSNEMKRDKVRSGFKSVKKDTYTIREKSEFILSKIKISKEIKFRDLFNETFEKLEAVVTFLAILELMKGKDIKVIQENIFDEIIICEGTL